MYRHQRGNTACYRDSQDRSARVQLLFVGLAPVPRSPNALHSASDDSPMRRTRGRGVAGAFQHLLWTAPSIPSNDAIPGSTTLANRSAGWGREVPVGVRAGRGCQHGVNRMGPVDAKRLVLTGICPLAFGRSSESTSYSESHQHWNRWGCLITWRLASTSPPVTTTRAGR